MVTIRKRKNTKIVSWEVRIRKTDSPTITKHFTLRSHAERLAKDTEHKMEKGVFKKGLNVMEVGAITGHKDLRMLQRYTHPREEDLALKFR